MAKEPDQEPQVPVALCVASLVGWACCQRNTLRHSVTAAAVQGTAPARNRPQVSVSANQDCGCTAAAAHDEFGKRSRTRSGSAARKCWCHIPYKAGLLATCAP